MRKHAKAHPHNQQPLTQSQTLGPESAISEGLSVPSKEGNALQRIADNSHMVRQRMAFQATANASHQASQLKTLQLADNTTPAQRPANTGTRSSLPAQLRMGIEELSGISMESVSVHLNSARPSQSAPKATSPMDNSCGGNPVTPGEP